MSNSRFNLTAPGPLRLYSWAEVISLPAPTWLVDGIIPRGSMTAIYGKPETFKSFVALDIALSVATSQPWHGREVEGGSVIYVAAEGGAGMSKRARAWFNHHDVHPNTAAGGCAIEPIVVGRESEQLENFIQRIEESETIPALIVLDTL